MKITFLALWAYKLFDENEPAQFGGAELQLYLLANYLVKQSGTKVEFITRGQGPFRRITTESGIEVIKLPYRSSSIFRSILGLWDMYKACIRSDADVLIQRGGGVETGVVARAATKRRKPFVFMCSSIWDADRVNEKKRGILLGALYQYGLKRSSTIIAQTVDQQTLLQQNYGRESLVLRSAHQIPEQLPEPTREVLWVGRCDTTKRPERFLDLAEALPHHTFTMVCPLIHPNNVHFSMFQDLENRAKGMKNVVFYPGVSFEQTEQLFGQHRLSVNTSDKEGYPNTFVQSFKWARPVVSLNVDPDELLTDKQLGKTANGDWDNFKQTIESLLANDEDWRRLSQNARRFAEEQYDINRIGQAFLNHIQQLV